MLAVQPAPRMGSSNPPNDPFLPFGYSFNPDEEPLPEPPEPSGDSLLNENDTRALGSFFEDMTNDQWNNLSFGEGLNFSNAWLDLPPTFVGSTTSFGQQPDGSMTSPGQQAIFNDLMTYPRSTLGSHPMAPPPPPPPPTSQSQPAHHQLPQPQQLHQQHYQPSPQNLQPLQLQNSHVHHSDDVLSAAATLLHNNTTPRAAHQDYSLSRRQNVPPVGHLRHQPMEEFREEGLRSIQQEQGFSQDWMNPQAARNQRLTTPLDYQWGSDSNFSAVQAYTPEAAKKETVESHHQEQLGLMECLEVNKSAGSTRPSSPSLVQPALPGNRARRVSISEPVKSRDDPELPPRKRRKSRTAKDIPEEEDEDEERTELKTARKAKVKTEKGNDNSPGIDMTPKAAKRRGSTKTPRENLTDEQKRENHIKSEQKRRTLIKEGFEDLCELVPGLRGGGFSKSTMLTMAAEWLEELLQGNEVLSAQLAEIEGRS